MASKRRIRRRSCDRKRRHASKEGAMITLRKNKFRFGPMHVYHCPFCNGYHLGH